MKNKIAVLGAGAWGTTLSLLLAENGHSVTLWAYENEIINELKKYRENKTFLPGFQLPGSVEFTNDINQAVLKQDLLLFVIPVQHLPATIKRIRSIPKNALLLSASKGIDIKSLKLPSQIIGAHFKRETAVLSGPNLAFEVARGLPSVSVIGSNHPIQAKKIQDILTSPRFRIYTQRDAIGVELGGALKNIIAVAAGIVDGLSLGENSRAGLIVRGITEIARFGSALGAKGKTFYGLSGIGDLLLTCSSASSRNHRVGVRISRGEKLKEIISGTRQVAEGVPTTRAVFNLARRMKIEMPITAETYSVLFKNKDPYKAVSDLLTRKLKEED